jgi:hypothetical protein
VALALFCGVWGVVGWYLYDLEREKKNNGCCFAKPLREKKYEDFARSTSFMYLLYYLRNFNLQIASANMTTTNVKYFFVSAENDDVVNHPEFKKLPFIDVMFAYTQDKDGQNCDCIFMFLMDKDACPNTLLSGLQKCGLKIYVYLYTSVLENLQYNGFVLISKIYTDFLNGQADELTIKKLE